MVATHDSDQQTDNFVWLDEFVYSGRTLLMSLLTTTLPPVKKYIMVVPNNRNKTLSITI